MSWLIYYYIMPSMLHIEKEVRGRFSTHGQDPFPSKILPGHCFLVVFLPTPCGYADVLHICHYLMYVKTREFAVGFIIINPIGFLFTLFFQQETSVIHVFGLFLKLEKTWFWKYFLFTFLSPVFSSFLCSAMLHFDLISSWAVKALSHVAIYCRNANYVSYSTSPLIWHNNLKDIFQL